MLCQTEDGPPAYLSCVCASWFDTCEFETNTCHLAPEVLRWGQLYPRGNVLGACGAVAPQILSS